MFNPEQFLDQQIVESNSTQSVPVPVGEFLSVASEVKSRQWTAKDDPSKTGIALDIIWNIDDASVKELLGREKVTVKQGIMLDINEAGQLDMGKGRNVGLGRLREALGLNVPGQPFSFNMIPGRVAKISISHRIDGENIYAEVKAIAKVQ
jgi:hypothetical protein